MCSLAVPRDAASSLNAEGGWGVNVLGRLGRTIFNRFVSKRLSQSRKGKERAPDTPAVEGLWPWLALDLSFPIWK